MKKDYYEILGVRRDATAQDIKSAYRKLAVNYHPDRNPGDPAAEEKFKEAAEAYSVLGDPEKRAQYDRFGHSGVGGDFSGFDADIFADFGDILGDFFGFGDLFGGSRRRSRSHRGTDLRYDLTVEFEDAVFGTKAKLRIPRTQTCSHCQGTGADPKHGTEVCTTCGGHGQVRFQQGFFVISRECSACRGTGRIVREPCPECKGQGRTQKERVLEVRVPAGVETGTRLRITGEGDAGYQGGPPGDLYVSIQVKDHPFFRRQGDDLLCEVPINFAQAALGCEIKVPTLEGDHVLKIPPGTQSGTVFRLRGKGVLNLNGMGRGDQLVKVVVRTPKKLSDRARNLLKELAEELGPADEPESEEGFFSRVKDMFS